MGWGRLLLLGDLGQQLDLRDAQSALAEMRTEVARLQVQDSGLHQKVARLEHENEELKLYLTAVVRLLRRKQLVTDSELHAMVAAVDGDDGNPDGRYNGPIVPG